MNVDAAVCVKNSDAHRHFVDSREEATEEGRLLKYYIEVQFLTYLSFT